MRLKMKRLAVCACTMGMAFMLQGNAVAFADTGEVDEGAASAGIEQVAELDGAFDATDVVGDLDIAIADDQACEHGADLVEADPADFDDVIDDVVGEDLSEPYDEDFVDEDLDIPFEEDPVVEDPFEEDLDEPWVDEPWDDEPWVEDPDEPWVEYPEEPQDWGVYGPYIISESECPDYPNVIDGAAVIDEPMQFDVECDEDISSEEAFYECDEVNGDYCDGEYFFGAPAYDFWDAIEEEDALEEECFDDEEAYEDAEWDFDEDFDWAYDIEEACEDGDFDWDADDEDAYEELDNDAAFCKDDFEWELNARKEVAA